MRITKYRWYWAWEFEKEEKWLNEMAAQGWALVSVGYCRYEFEPCEPGSCAVRLELLNSTPGSVEGQQYISFVEDTGAQYVGHVMRWAYFRKNVADGAFDLYSDLDSRITHLGRITALLLPLLILNIGNTFSQTANALATHNEWSAFPGAVAAAAALVSILLGYGLYRINRMRMTLVKERQLRE